MRGAIELIRQIEASGGAIQVDGADIVIWPPEVAAPLIDELRVRKPEIIALLCGPVGLWMLARCQFRDRVYRATADLHLDHAAWLAENSLPVMASRQAFESALRAEGFAVTAEGLTYGLVLRSDAEAVFSPPVPSKVPAISPERKRGPAKRQGAATCDPLLTQQKRGRGEGVSRER